jgi:bifunctional UDP-N-acetylglucosamine pyrophosphorylase/glucosamine-1-phosphate N-acetyltransferase
MSDPPVSVIVLAAGKGSRMKSDLHKVLHTVAGKTMFDHLYETIQNIATKTIVVVGHGRDQLEKAIDTCVDIVVQEPQLGTGHAVQMAENKLKDDDSDVLILYGDVPFVRIETMRAMIDRLNGNDKPAVVVLGFEPKDTLQYGRVIVKDDRIVKMVEHKDANEEERMCRLCNSGIMAVKSKDLFDLLSRVNNNNVQSEYYLTDIVNIANLDGRTCVSVIIDDEFEVMGINSREELADAERIYKEHQSSV